jgi:Rrf2 family transcriptional regulator, iron-sulfur cluster assembly transcription factor
MRLSTKSRFAVTAMIDMGLRQNQGPVSLAAISKRQQISVSYLEQIFSNMREHGLVESTRGPGGGYSLSRDPNLISVAHIIHAVNSPNAQEAASVEGLQSGYVVAEELWTHLNQKMDDHMQSISLQSLIAAQISKGGEVTANNSPKRGVFAKKSATAQTRKIPNSVFALGNA